MKRTASFFILVFFVYTGIFAQSNRSKKTNLLRSTDKAFFMTEEAQRIGNQVVAYQRVTGGWPKNIDMCRQLSKEELAEVIKQKSRRNDSTTDNNATTTQLLFLARLYKATGGKEWKEACKKAVDYLISGQYENGGWPQFWPEMRDYQVHITYNDNAMVNTLSLFQDIINGKEPFDSDLSDKATKERLKKSFDKGIECILNTQIVVKGKPTVWCQQHDRNTMKPAPARAYELPSFCSQESCEIVRLLMTLPNPDKRVRKAVHSAMAWFDKYKLTGLRVTRTGEKGSTDRDTKLVKDAGGSPLWARFYDLDRCEPFVCDRDGIPRRSLEEIGRERRGGYSWFNNYPALLYPLYEQWADKYDKRNKVRISLSTKGANENGTIDMSRKPSPDKRKFNVIVKAGESIQQAIEKAPLDGAQPFKILLLKGTYSQKVIIDRPNIILVGEDRDSTIIVLAEGAKSMPEGEYRGKPIGRGVISITEDGNDCVISGLTVYNNYGTTVENTTSHQFAIYGRGTRTIVVNCNVWADGNDALALWAKGGDGMYYHADLDLRCPGVDFLCPRGWCYATRCRFYGDGRAIIWHDGRGDKTKKLVIKDSSFDAKRPTILGRWHHDSQFFLVNCHMSENILDTNISYAYSDKVLDPCPWGQRTYYFGCTRDGGNSGWLRNNLQESEEKPEFHAITASWTFDNKWNPEKRLRELWDVVQYSILK